MTRFFLLFLVSASCGGCAEASDQASDVRTQRLAALDRIASECGVPRTMFRLVGSDELHLLPPPDAPYERVDCALRRVRETNISLGNIGFVGNEAPAPEASNAQAH